MKKLILATIFALVSLATQAQTFEEGDLNISAGIGLGSWYGSSIPVSASVEYGINENISAGGYIGYLSYNPSWSGNDFRVNITLIGPRASYHFTDWDTGNWDLYAGAFAGVAIVSYSNGYRDTWGYTGPGSFRISGYAGGRYNFSDNMAAFSELGYGIEYLRVGATFKLK